MDIENARQFWQVAQKFPPEKETVYPAHAAAHGFDEQAGKRVLEYGCGGGSDTISLLRRGANVFFVDIVPGNVQLTQRRVDEFFRGVERTGAVAHAAARAHSSEPPRGLGCVLESSDILPFEEACFDTITCHGVLHHIEETLMHRVIDEMRRVLKPGGRLYVMLYTELLLNRCLPTMKGFMQQQGWSLDRAFGYMTDGGSDKHWCIARAYTEEEGRALFEAHGFAFISAVEYNERDFRAYRLERRKST
jgi:SAM-dependent methyltransferase